MSGRVWAASWLLAMTVVTASVGAQPEVPRFRDVVGHEFGADITRHHQMVRYLEALAAASPRVSLIEQGVSWEGRRLLAAVISSPENHARLDEIRANAALLGDPRRLPPAGAETLIAGQPAVAWLGGSIHGFELSGSEGLLRVVERLSTGDDEATRRILDQVVTLVDPMLNPDGRDAFAEANRQARSTKLNSRRDHWGNDWDFWEALRFRTGHYFFDTNRDWFAHTQRETRGRIPTLLAWRPQVMVDAHEMGPDVEFFFDPADDPYPPFFPGFARAWFERFNAAYAAAFDKAGLEYMTRERYNYFYPGYTTSYGSFQGAVGMLYEQGSSRGLALERADGSVRTLSDALEQQATAAWAALELAASERKELLGDYVEAHRRAIADRSGAARYLIPPGGDPRHRVELGDLLGRNGIEVGVLDEAATLVSVRDRTGGEIGRRSFAAGTLVVETGQPRNRLIRTLLDPEQPVPGEFLEEARKRLDRGENPRFYDITAWSLPLMFGLEAFSSTDGRSLPLSDRSDRSEHSAPRVSEGTPPEKEPIERAGYAYLMDGRQAASAAALFKLRKKGFRAAVTLRPTRIGERELASGTAVFRVGQNGEDLHAAVRQVAAGLDLEVLAVDTGLADPEAPISALGSGDVVPFKEVEIALLAGAPVHAYSFGWTWYVLTQRYDLPVTVRRVATLGEKPLDDFDVLVIPDLFSADELAERLGEKGEDRLRRWVKDGGTLVVTGNAVDFVRQGLDLISLRSFYPDKEEEDDEPGEGRGQEKAEEPQRFTVPGAFLRAGLDAESWLSAGYQGEIPALVFSDRVFLEPEGPPDAGKRVVARYDGTVLSGHAWPESLERLAGAVFAYEEKVGHGRVIAFAEDLCFRGYYRAADRLFLNAVVLGPSAP